MWGCCERDLGGVVRQSVGVLSAKWGVVRESVWGCIVWVRDNALLTNISVMSELSSATLSFEIQSLTRLRTLLKVSFHVYKSCLEVSLCT